jgi:hypothetical protein
VGSRLRWIGVFVALVVTFSIPTVGVAAETPNLRITMVGDSVLLGARDALLAQFAGQQVSVDAVENRSLLGAISMFQSAGPALGDVVVLDLGYNDSSDPAVFRERIDGAMAALAGVKHVIWLNQHDWGPGRAGMNAELAAAATRYPNLDVADWNAEVAAHPEDVYTDSIHLTPAGQTAMAAMVRSHFDQYVASLTPTTTAATTPATTTPVTNAAPAPAQAPARTAPSAPSTNDDTRDVAELLGLAGLVVVAGGAGIVGARRWRAQRRASSSARRASASVTGSRQANRSHT